MAQNWSDVIPEFDTDSHKVSSTTNQSPRSSMSISNDPTTADDEHDTIRQSIAALDNAPTSGSMHPSISCPSLPTFHDVSSDFLRDIPVDGSQNKDGSLWDIFSSEHENVSNLLGEIDDYASLLNFQQQYQDSTMRNFPYRPTGLLPEHTYMLTDGQFGRRANMPHAASFTSLSNMEADYRRNNNAAKRKKGNEEWSKLQRHKSFDSTASTITMSSPTTSMERSLSITQFPSTPENTAITHTAADTDMLGFSMGEFQANVSHGMNGVQHRTMASYAMAPMMGNAQMDNFGDYMDLSSLSLSQVQAVNGKTDPREPNSTSNEPLELTYRDQEEMSDLLDLVGGKGDKQEPSPKTRSAAPPKNGRKRSTKHAANSSSIPVAVPSLHSRLKQIITTKNSNVALTQYEADLLKISPLFSPSKASETAGSLWLLLHVTKCQNGCSINGCTVMQRVLKHVLKCPLPLDKCKGPCNDSKMMLLHHSICRNSPLAASCGVCVALEEIDRAHNALSRSPTFETPQLPPPANPIPIAPQPPKANSRHRSTSGNTTPSAAPGASTMPTSTNPVRHVPIRPNPLPTSTANANILASTGTNVTVNGLDPISTPFGGSLALYQEQTSASFRAEMKARIDQRVTAAAGQDLIQHMKTKTRLRSVEDLRADARLVVLREMERELHAHLHSFGGQWGQLPSGFGNTSMLNGAENNIPSYLLNIEGFGNPTFMATSLPAPGVVAPQSRPVKRQFSTNDLTISGRSNPIIATKTSTNSASTITPSASKPTALRRKKSAASDLNRLESKILNSSLTSPVQPSNPVTAEGS